MTIEERYRWACDTPSDISALIPVLRKYGEQCQHVTEFGVRNCVSLSAWLAARPKKIVCYDVGYYPALVQIENLALGAGIEFRFHCESTANSKIHKTDLLFVDTVHNAFQLSAELKENHYAVQKFMIFHDTDTYGIYGEGGAPGLWRCIIPFLAGYKEEWKILEHRPESNGLTVLSRIA